MGWWDDFMDLARTAGSAYYTIATNPDARKAVAGKIVDSFNDPRTIGEKLVSGVEAYSFISGHNPNDIPQTAKDVIRGAGDAAGFLESQLPGIGAIHAGLATATELAAGRDPAHLGEFAVETAVAFAPHGVGEAYSLLKNLSDLPATSAVINKEISVPSRSAPLQPRIPVISYMPRPRPEPLAPKAEPKIPAEVPVPKPSSSKPPDVKDTYELFGDLGKTKTESRAKFEPSYVSKTIPAEVQAYSRVQRLDNLAKSHQQEIGSFTPRPIGMSRKAFIQEHQHLVKVLEKAKPAELKKEAMSQFAELKKVKRRIKKTK